MRTNTSRHLRITTCRDHVTYCVCWKAFVDRRTVATFYNQWRKNDISLEFFTDATRGRRYEIITIYDVDYYVVISYLKTEEYIILRKSVPTKRFKLYPTRLFSLPLVFYTYTKWKCVYDTRASIILFILYFLLCVLYALLRYHYYYIIARIFFW